MANEFPDGFPSDPLASHTTRPAGAYATSDPTQDLPPRTILRWMMRACEEDTHEGEPDPGQAPVGYELLSQIAGGGMGEVWEAIQVSLGRVVAVKMIRRDLLKKDRLEPRALRRRQIDFQREAIVSARLEHPNILPVHDFGVDDDGNPLLAMKRIYGTPWNQLLLEDFAELSPQEFLARHIPILIDVAQGVAFAHSRGIVHRDIKPSQVMVGEFGEVLLTDWGLAVEVTQVSSSEVPRAGAATRMPTLHTATNPCGTAVLMAPEQTMQTTDGIGFHTDVYLLAGTLYYLLTGTYPHAVGDSRRSFWHASMGTIDPPEERAPGRWIPPELRDLCLGGLAPDVSKRLDSVTDFIAGLEDYLSGATRRRESTAITDEVERMLKTASDDYSVFGDCTSRLQQAGALWPENPQLPSLKTRTHAGHGRAALERGDLALARIQAELLDAGTQRDELLAKVQTAEAQAIRQRKKLRRAVATSFILLIVLLSGSIAGGYTFRKQRNAEQRLREQAEAAQAVAVERARASQGLVNFMLEDLGDSLRSDVPRDAELIGKVADRVMEHFDEIDTSRDSREIRLEHAAGLLRVSHAISRLAKYDEAIRLTQQSADIREKLLGKETMEWADSIGEVGRNYDMMGDTASAEPILRESMRLLRENAPRDSEEFYSGLIRLARLERELADWPNAEKLFLESLEVAREASDVAPRREALALGNLGGLYRFQGRREEAEEMFRQSLEITQKLYGPESEETGYRTMDLGIIAKDRGRLDEGRELLEHAEVILSQKLGPNHPGIVQTISSLGDIAYVTGDLEKATGYYNRCMTIQESVFGPDYYYLAPTLQALGTIHFRQGDYEEARACLNRALELQNKEHGENSVYHVETLMTLAALYDQSGNKDLTEETFKQILSILEENYSPDHPNVGVTKSNLALFYYQQGRYSEADPLYRQALANLTKAYGAAHPFTSQTCRSTALNLYYWADESDPENAPERWQVLQQFIDENRGGLTEVVADRFQAEVWMGTGEREKACELVNRLVQENDDLGEAILRLAEECGIGVPPPASDENL
ncbi:serine/threonine-protein kinase [bacterium]|nr:serine/threonine-protein kinase [bacterium]